jgi:hypothetical protein
MRFFWDNLQDAREAMRFLTWVADCKAGRTFSEINASVRLEGSPWVCPLVSRRLLNAEDPVQCQGSPSGICCGQSATETCLSLRNSIFSCQLSLQQCFVLSCHEAGKVGLFETATQADSEYLRCFFFSMALPAHSGPWPFIQFRNHFSQMVGLLGRVISSSQGRYLNTGQHKHIIKTYTRQISMP